MKASRKRGRSDMWEHFILIAHDKVRWHNRLSPKSVEQIMFLNQNLRLFPIQHGYTSTPNLCHICPAHPFPKHSLFNNTIYKKELIFICKKKMISQSLYTGVCVCVCVCVCACVWGENGFHPIVFTMLELA